MALIDVDLGGTQTVIINEDTADDGDFLNITGLGNSELIVDGVSVETQSIAGIEAGSSSTFTVQNGGALTVNQGLLNVSALSEVNFNIVGASQMTLDASSVSALNGLSSYNVTFSGEEPGTFTFDKPDLSLLDSYNFNFSGMQAGDQIILDGEWNLATQGGTIFDPADPESAYYDGALHLVQGNPLLGGAVTASIEMSQEDADLFFSDPDAYLAGGSFTTPGEVICFAAGTLIATPAGEVAVETLKIGDLVTTAEGKHVPVKWVGRQTVRNLYSAVKLQPVRVSAGALGAGKPSRDLVLTASHGLIIDGLVINAGALVNGSSIDFVSWKELPDTVTYYHVETENHEVILANGTEAETYIDYIERKAFNNYDEYVALYGAETRIAEMPRVRISARRLLPFALRRRLGIQDAPAYAALEAKAA
ncbi:Hint domain-containing protein [Bordetella sp. 2513F-2]